MIQATVSRFWVKGALWSAFVLGGAGAALAAAGEAVRVDPYWASITQSEANMRTGPSTDFPIKWVYKRKNLPVKVVAKLSIWRKVEDHDGDQGWMYVKLLSPTRTAIVTGNGIAEMRDAPRDDARLSWRAEPGVVGKITDCAKDWCLFDVAGRTGYIRTDAIWGDEDLTVKP